MGLYEAINAYIEAGDEVLVLEPTWVSFSQQVRWPRACLSPCH